MDKIIEERRYQHYAFALVETNGPKRYAIRMELPDGDYIYTGARDILSEIKTAFGNVIAHFEGTQRTRAA